MIISEWNLTSKVVVMTNNRHWILSTLVDNIPCGLLVSIVNLISIFIHVYHSCSRLSWSLALCRMLSSCTSSTEYNEKANYILWWYCRVVHSARPFRLNMSDWVPGLSDWTIQIDQSTLIRKHRLEQQCNIQCTIRSIIPQVMKNICCHNSTYSDYYQNYK